MKFKKLIISLITFVIMSQAISATTVDFEVGFTAPYSNGFYKDKNQKYNNGIGGLHGGLDLGLNVMFTDFMGLGFNIEHFGSVFTTYTVEGHGISEKTGKETYLKDNKTNIFFTNPQFSTTFFLGPTIRPVANERFVFDITPGADINLITIVDGGILNRKDPSFFYFIFETGCGIDLNFKWKKSDKSWISVGLLTTYNFFSLINGYNTVFDEIPNDDVALDKITIKNMASPNLILTIAPRIGAVFFF